MFKRSRLALSVAAAVGAMASTGSLPALAQDPAVEQIEEVVVTGSRIRRTDLTSMSPISVFDEAALDRQGSTTLERFFVSLPSVSGADFGSGVNNATAGVSTVSLRGLGPTRTLVLLNGNRMASAGVSGFVDLNLIPSSLIERVEVLRDGASTVYGSDAIAGVVNLITKTDFDGVEIEGQYDETGEGDGEQKLFAITFGKSFDRGNIVVNAQYQERDEIWQGERSFSECAFRERGSLAAGTRERFCGGSDTAYPGTAWISANEYAERLREGRRRAAPLQRRHRRVQLRGRLVHGDAAGRLQLLQLGQLRPDRGEPRGDGQRLHGDAVLQPRIGAAAGAGRHLLGPAGAHLQPRQRLRRAGLRLSPPGGNRRAPRRAGRQRVARPARPEGRAEQRLGLGPVVQPLRVPRRFGRPVPRQRAQDEHADRSRSVRGRR